MEYRKIENEYPKLSSCAVTLGKFDGIHRGHRRLVWQVLRQKENGLPAVLFAIGGGEQMIFSRQERARLLEGMGMDLLLECPLSPAFMHMEAEAFVRNVLAKCLHASRVVIGEDYRFGFERKGTPKLLETLGKKYGFAVDVIPKEMDGNRKISSTFIREELARGNMEKAARLLGIPYFVDGKVEHGRGLGHKMLLPTINLTPAADKLTPPNGVYITVSHFAGKTWRGITNIGHKPTVGERIPVGVETYLFDCSENLYGESGKVAFLHFLRPEQKFNSLEALKSQLLRDAGAAKDWFCDRKIPAFPEEFAYDQGTVCMPRQHL